MKWMFTFVVLFAAVPSFADHPENKTKVQYDSWCEGEKIMTTDRDGQIYTAWDCTEISERSRCVEQAEKQGAWTFITATCTDRRDSFTHQPSFCESYEDFEDCPPSRPGPDDVDGDFQTDRR